MAVPTPNIGATFPLDDSAYGTHRLTTPADAYEVMSTLITANEARNIRLASIKGMLDGNPPFPSGKLKAIGQGWRNNWSTLEGRAVASAACVPFYDLASSSATLLSVECHYGDPTRRDEWSQIIAEEADRVIKSWAAFDTRLFRLIYNFVCYGRGFLGWPEDGDWRFKMWPHDRVLFPDGVDLDPDALDLFIVRSSYTVGELYRKIKHLDIATEVGWNAEAVRAAINRAVPNEPMAGQFTDHVALQRAFTDKDAYWNARCNTVNAAQIFIREHSGKWSRFLIEETGQPGAYGTRNRTDPKDSPTFLYQRFEAYDDLCEIMSPFFFEPRDDTWNGATGLGKDLFAPMQAKDRLRMSQLDATFMRGSLILRAITPAALNTVPLSQLGACTIIGPDFEAQQSTMLGDIESATVVNRDLDSMLQSNTGVYRPRMDKPQGNPRTATEAQQDFMQSTVLGESAVNRFYCQLDPTVQQLFVRLCKGEGPPEATKAARAFKKACKERGVPDEIWRKVTTDLDSYVSVRASRAIGSGSKFVRQQAILSLAPITGGFPEAGRQAWHADVIAAATNQTKVARYLPQPGVPNRMDEHMRLALLENAALKEGAPIVRVAVDNDMIHAQVHMAAMGEAVGSLEKGADPAVVLAFLHAAGPHVLQHLQGLQLDEATKDQTKAMVKQWQQLAGIADQLAAKLQKDAETKAQAEAVQSGQDPDTQLKQAELEAKLALAERKTNAGIMQKQQKLDASIAQGQQKQDATLARERMTTTQKMALEDAKTAHELMLAQAKGRNGDED